jgi:transmembrane sensor
MTQRDEWRDMSAVEVEAAAWIAQLDSGRCSAADEVALREWCARSDANRDALPRLDAIWSQLDELVVLESRLMTQPERQTPATRRRWTPSWAAYAAAAVLALLIGALVWTGRIPGIGDVDPPVRIYATQIGELKTIELADGSIAQLNTDTLLEIGYRTDERRVRVVRGEALFDVAKDVERPFVVSASATMVRAVGTQFAVHLAQDQDVEVVVSEGLVELAHARSGGSGAAQPVAISRLRPRQVAHIAAAAAVPVRIQTIDAGELARRLLWTTGMLEFRGEPLERVIAEVGRYTPLKIEIHDPQLRALPVSGRFRVGDTQALFGALENGFGATAVREGGIVIIALDNR